MAIMPNKTWEINNNQGKKKMVVKIGGGGIGAFVLLGGALATAALVSAFVVGRTGRSSGKDRRQNPPPEVEKQNEQDEAVLDHQPSDVGGAKTEVVEPDTDTEKVSIQKSAPDQKPIVEEINGGKTDELDDVEAISDRSDITDEGFPLSDDKLPLDDDAVEKIPLTNEDVVSNEISKEIENLEQVCIQEEEEERETNDGGEMQPRQEGNGVEGVRIDQIEVQRNASIDEIKSNMEEQESKDFCSDNKEIAIESIKVDLAAIGLELSESDSSLVGVSESQSESGIKAFVPVFDSRVIIEHENVDGKEKERALPVEEEDEANEGSQEEQVKYIEEQLVKEDQIPYENRGFEEPMLKEELILHQDVEVVKDDGAIEEEGEGIETNEEKEKSMQLVNSQPNEDEDDDEENIAEEIKEELISHADVEVVKEEIANEKVVAEMNENEALMQFVVVDQPKLGEGDYLIIMETSEDEANCKDNIKKIDYDEDETVLSDEVEETSEGSGDSSMESNSEAVYPVDSPQGTTVEPRETELLNQEVEGKIQEDKAIKKDDSQFIGEDSETQKVKSLNETFIEKYVEKNRRVPDRGFVNHGYFKARLQIGEHVRVKNY
ncbi:PREDICTED: eukaryotic translation initiation factor 5B-like isoform X2 [Erythranthe guttata]|uniref:eukaryotic translation initiation factor 5B-like isoform X2 n=1 Tax=Erythranthe guttata TaxID=4155 RepID=UPI00064DC0B5|nr:PREDICTED: eukaryotic translation initiation factor 5B-like isoform X2 [Erythranthe guttata]|eukprot:XP_012833823.1 PREDICTED: eukaryotic translation initiation factor 5B-like isoform X2 [Erythranthe guttata]